MFLLLVSSLLHRDRGVESSCRELEELARMLYGLAHPIRLAIVALLARREEMYLAEIASALGVSRELAKIHLKKLESAGLVESTVVLEKGKAMAKRF
jgi:DNA-binding transcriptional ArsR family regulator